MPPEKRPASTISSRDSSLRQFGPTNPNGASRGPLCVEMPRRLGAKADGKRSKWLANCHLLAICLIVHCRPVQFRSLNGRPQGKEFDSEIPDGIPEIATWLHS